MNKKGALPLIFIALIFIGAILVISPNIINTASLVGSGNYIERPVFYYDKCEAVSSYKYSDQLDLAKNGQWLQKPSITDKYDILIKTPKTPLIQGAVEYYVCNSKVFSKENCRIYSQRINQVSNYQIISINNIRPNEEVWAQYQSLILLKFSGASGATYQIGFIPYGIRQYNVLGGSSNLIDGGDCKYNNAPTDTILSTDSNKIKAVAKVSESNQNELQPEEVRWYVAGYLTSSAESFVLTYNGQDAWCRSTGDSAEIYKINSITTKQGTYKIASPDWSDYLGKVNCCPGSVQGSNVCSKDYKWIQTSGSECGAFKSCGSPNWVPNSEKQIIKYSCVNGYCKSETKDVECASDLACTDSNTICDLNTHTCVQANVNLNGQVIETIADNLADCQKAGGKWVSETTTKNTFLSIVGITEPTAINKEYCDMSKTNYLLWILIIAGSIILYLFILRPILKGTPAGRYLP